jgi:hypothetical protein
MIQGVAMTTTIKNRKGRKRKSGRRQPDGRLAPAPKVSPSMYLAPIIGENRAIYLIEAGQRAVKIGISGNPAHRRNELQVGNDTPLRLTWWAWMREPDAARAEAVIHERLGRTVNSANGEWYYMAADTALAFIDRLLTELAIEHWDDQMFRMAPRDWNRKLLERVAARGTGQNYTAGFNCEA